MATLLNLRGTNGSGKSYLARRFFGDHDAQVDLLTYQSKSGKDKLATGQLNPELSTLVVGSYSTQAGGLDKLPTFAVQLECIEIGLDMPEVDVVVAEGVLASTVLGSWAEHAKKLREYDHRVIWAFLSTPVEVCLQRIQARNGGKPIKENLVHDKWTQIDRVRQKAECRPWIEVVQLPYEGEWEKIQEVLGW